MQSSIEKSRVSESNFGKRSTRELAQTMAPQPPKLDKNNKPLSGGAALRKRGAAAIIEIQKEQANNSLVCSRKAFHRICSEILSQVSAESTNTVNHFSKDALSALQTEAEAHLASLFSDALTAGIKNGKVTLHPNFMNQIINFQNGDWQGQGFGEVHGKEAQRRGIHKACDE